MRNGNIWWNRYTIVAVGMTLTMLIGVALYLLDFRYAVLVVEIILIIEFGVLWLVQTAELQNQPVRHRAAAEDDLVNAE
jgi:ABC-type nickel/cobalt efflux system permease component RcnA